MQVQIRTFGGNEVKLCEHISVAGELNEDSFPSCEYKEYVSLTCNVCKQKHTVIVAVN
jgi:hypothetical protein